VEVELDAILAGVGVGRREAENQGLIKGPAGMGQGAKGGGAGDEPVGSEPGGGG